MATIADGDYYIINAASSATVLSNRITVYRFEKYSSDGRLLDFVMTTSYPEYIHAYFSSGFADHDPISIDGTDQTVPVYGVLVTETVEQPSGSGKDLDDIAIRVIRGDFGNGDERKRALRAAGYSPEEVQDRVNEILGLSVRVSSKDQKVSYHRYTTDKATYEKWKAAGECKDLGVVFAANSKGNGRSPVFMVTNRNGIQYFTASEGSKNRKISDGWTDGGVAFYSDGVMALDLSSDRSQDGTNIQVYPLNDTDAQIWTVKMQSDGSRKITNRYNGKNIDVLGGCWDNGTHDGTYVDGQNVILYYDDGASNQKWTITKTGSTLSYQGTSYDVCEVSLWGDPNGKKTTLGIPAPASGSGIAAGTNVDIEFNENTTNRAWIFVPVPAFRPNAGAYVIRAYYDWNLMLDCQSDSNYANVFLSGDRAGRRSFWLVMQKQNGKYVIANYAGGKVLDVLGRDDELVSGKNVQIFDYDACTEDWDIQEYETINIDGVKGTVVSFEIGSNGLRLDAENGQTSNGTNVRIWPKNDSSAQRWILEPADPYDPDIPVPGEIRLCSAPGYYYGGDRAYQPTLYPGWTAPSGWQRAFVGSEYFQFRWMSRKYDGLRGRWTEWISPSDWQIADITVDDDGVFYLKNGINTSYDVERYSNMEVRVDVRCAGRGKVYSDAGDHSADFIGLASSKTAVGDFRTGTHRNTFVPTLTITDAVMSFDGLHIGFTSDYKLGYVNIFIESIFAKAPGSSAYADILEPVSNGSESRPVKVECNPKSDNIVIPLNIMKKPIGAGYTVEVHYYVGNDQQHEWTWRTWDGTVAVTRNGGNSSLIQGLEQFTNHTALLPIKTMEHTGAWIYQNGNVFALPVHDTQGNCTRYLVPYTWGPEPSQVFASAYGSDSKDWQTAQLDLEAAAINHTPVHVWLLDDGTEVCLDCRKDSPLSSKGTISASYSAISQESREHETVSFGSVKKNEFTIEGAIIHVWDPGEDTSMNTHNIVSDIEALAGKHTIYRNPYGKIMYAAVTKVDEESYHDYTTVQVTMIQETR